MKGYMVTTEREDAPRRILSDRYVFFELNIVKKRVLEGRRSTYTSSTGEVLPNQPTTARRGTRTLAWA